MRILQGAAGVKYFSVWKKFVLRLGRDFPQGGVRRPRRTILAPSYRPSAAGTPAATWETEGERVVRLLRAEALAAQPKDEL